MQVSIQEFKTHLAKYIGQAQMGQAIELTSHRKVVAHIIGVPQQSASEGIMHLLSTGAAVWRGGKPSGAKLLLKEGGKPISTLVLEDR